MGRAQICLFVFRRLGSNECNRQFRTVGVSVMDVVEQSLVVGMESHVELELELGLESLRLVLSLV